MLRKHFQLGALATAVLLAGTSLIPTRLAAQAPAVLYGCYVPTSGTVYRIKADGLPSDCKSKNHVQFTWSLQGPVGPQGPIGPAGPQGVAGPSGPVSGLEIVTLAATVLTNTSSAIFASCPTGKKILGGGYSGVTLDQMRVERNGPGQTISGFSTTSWEVLVKNDNDNSAATVTAYAICANAQ